MKTYREETVREAINTSPPCREQLHISTRVKINLLNISKCKCAIHWLYDLFSSKCRLRYDVQSESIRQIVIRHEAITLGPAYKEFGYNEHPPTMSRFL